MVFTLSNNNCNMWGQCNACNSLHLSQLPLVLDVETLCSLGGRLGEWLMPHGPEVALEVGHHEEGQQREGHQVQQGRLGSFEHLRSKIFIAS